MQHKAHRVRELFSAKNDHKLKVVLTGGPGVGKTSIVKQLMALHFDVKIEVFTELFGEADKKGKFKELFDNVPKLLQELVQFQSKLESSSSKDGVAFYDRGMVDIIGFAEQLGVSFDPIDQEIVDKANYDLVFIIEPLEERYYVQNTVRRQNYSESLEHHLKVTTAYRNYCLRKNMNHKDHLISVPHFKGICAQSSDEDLRLSIQMRTEFILDRILENESKLYAYS